MIRLVFVLFALILFGLTAYVASHRERNFLGMRQVAPAVQKELGRFCLAFVLGGLLALAAAIWPLKLLQLSALLIGALSAGLLGLRVPKYAAEA